MRRIGEARGGEGLPGEETQGKKTGPFPPGTQAFGTGVEVPFQGEREKGKCFSFPKYTLRMQLLRSSIHGLGVFAEPFKAPARSCTPSSQECKSKRFSDVLL